MAKRLCQIRISPFRTIRFLYTYIIASNTEDMKETMEPEKVPRLAVVTLEEALTTNGAIHRSGRPQRQELERNFNLLSICGVAITAGNTWIAIGGSVVRVSLAREIPYLTRSRSLPSTMGAPRGSYMNCALGYPFSIAKGCSFNVNSIAVSVFYWLIAASIAELASAMPSSGGGWSITALHFPIVLNPRPHLPKSNMSYPKGLWG